MDRQRPRLPEKPTIAVKPKNKPSVPPPRPKSKPKPSLSSCSSKSFNVIVTETDNLQIDSSSSSSCHNQNQSSTTDSNSVSPVKLKDTKKSPPAISPKPKRCSNISNPSTPVSEQKDEIGPDRVCQAGIKVISKTELKTTSVTTNTMGVDVHSNLLPSGNSILHVISVFNQYQ